MKKLWIVSLLFVLVCTPVLASTNGYEVAPYTGPERGMYEGGGDDTTLTFWELPFKLQLIYLSGLLATSVTIYKFLPLLLGRVRPNCKNQNRDEILKYISDKPGTTISDIETHLKLSRSAVRYHLKMLRIFDKIRYIKKGKIVTLFPNSDSGENVEMNFRHILHNDTKRSILEHIIQNPGRSNQDIVKNFGLDKSTVHWHIKSMQDEGILQFEKDGKYKKYFVDPTIETHLKNAISTTKLD